MFTHLWIIEYQNKGPESIENEINFGLVLQNLPKNGIERREGQVAHSGGGIVRFMVTLVL